MKTQGKQQGLSQKLYLQLDENEVLEDRSSTGRKRPWREKKMANEYLAQVYEQINPSKSKRLRECGDYLVFGKKSDGSMKLVCANSCRVRLCPVCNWRRSLKIFSHMTAIMEAAKSYKYRYIFLTLTVENCVGEDLSDRITAMMQGFDRFQRRKAVKQVAKGWYRALEITYNKDRGDYHPHFHVILAVNRSYFTNTRYYLKQSEWTQLWRESMRLDYNPVCDVRKIKGDTTKAVAETAKYAVKESDYLLQDEDLSREIVEVLDKALDKRRLIAYGGIFKELHKKLNLDDEVDGDLINTDVKEKDLSDDEKNEIAFVWASGLKNYYKINR